MQIWSAEIKELETLYTSIKGRFPELEKELEQLIKFDDANVILLYLRRCLEVIITDLCECELKRPRKTEPLKGIIDKLNREEKVPSHIIASMLNLNSLSTFGAHPKEFDPEQVRPILLNLATIIKWYLKYKDTQTISKVKTEEVKDEIKAQDDSTKQLQKLKKRLILLLSGLALVVVIVVLALFVFNIIGGRKQAEIDTELEKSIAVRPFKSLSDDPEKQYLADGVMDAILLHLSKIEDLRVMSRTSVEQYRETNKTATVIGQELDVAYLLEGSFQKYGDKARLIVQLIRTSDDSHVWSNEYDRDWMDIFSVQSEVAMAIASELKAIITPQEKQIIEWVPTTNLTAYDCYLRALEEHNYYRENWEDYLGRESALDRAILLYQLTLEYDSSFAKAYTGLAMAYRDKYYNKTYFEDNFLDSTLTLADIALSYDSKLEEAYNIRGDYYIDYGMYDEALKEYNLVLKFNPNYWQAYISQATIYIDMDNKVKFIENYQKAIKLNRGKELPELFRTLGRTFAELEMDNIAEYYFKEALRLDNDLVKHNKTLEDLEWRNYKRGKVLFTEEIEKINKMLEIDSTFVGGMLYRMAYGNSVLGNHKEAYKYWLEYAKIIEEIGGQAISVSHRIGYAYWQVGYKEEAKKYFDDHLYHCKESIRLNRPYANYMGAYYDLAGYYAFFGDKEKAYQYLEEFLNNSNYFGPGWFWWISFDPMFNDIREEERFQNILREMEYKDQKERERVRAWMEKNDLLQLEPSI